MLLRVSIKSPITSCCIYSNSPFKCTSGYFVHAVIVPGQPSVSVTSITATSISLSWSVPSDSVVTSYEVMWRETDSGATEMTSGSLTDTSYTIEQLDSTTIYTITVTASNTGGDTFSLPVIISTGIPPCDSRSNLHNIRESIDSLCRDGADMPRPPYIGKACTRPNLEDLSLFRYLTIVYESLCTQ